MSNLLPVRGGPLVTLVRPVDGGPPGLVPAKGTEIDYHGIGHRPGCFGCRRCGWPQTRSRKWPQKTPVTVAGA